MSKFKMPSPESFRENIESNALISPERKAELLAIVDYSSAHPLSLAEKREQARRGKAGNKETTTERS